MAKFGGPQPGSGRPKGSKNASTIEKEQARERLRQMVIAKMEPLVNAQIRNALGLAHLFIRDDAGRFVQITDPKVIETVLNAGEQDKYFYIHEKDPSIQAFTDLFNRTLDKPKEHVEMTGLDDGPLIVQWKK